MRKSTTIMTSEQKSEINTRSALYKQGKIKSSSWDDVKKRTRSTYLSLDVKPESSIPSQKANPKRKLKAKK